jgi:hypothetical protein
MHLHSHARDRYQKWNDIVDSIKVALEPLIAKKLVLAAEQLGPPIDRKEIKNAVAWDILSACMECEYSDVREPNFFCGLMELYLAGRFPCGWGEIDDEGNTRLLAPVEAINYEPNEPDPRKWVFGNQERVYNPKIQLPLSGQLVIY